MHSLVPALEINLGHIFDGNHEEGAHGWYKNLKNGLGIKVFRAKSMSLAINEFILCKYVESCGFTTNVLACGRVYVRSPYKDVLLHRPAIWMEHYEGSTINKVLDLIIQNCIPKTYLTKPYREQLKWAWESEEFLELKNQIERNLKVLKDGYGLECNDHSENFSNIILQPNGLMRIIDFSCEILTDEIKQKIYKQTYHALEQTVPPEPYFQYLVNKGYIQK